MNHLPFYNAGDEEKVILRNDDTYLTAVFCHTANVIATLLYVTSILFTTAPVRSLRHCYVASSLEIVNLCGFCSKDYMKSHANDTDM
jgi:hypothetical protein